MRNEENFNGIASCVLSNLFDNEQQVEVILSFLENYKKYGSAEQQQAIKNFVEGINFCKEQNWLN